MASVSAAPRTASRLGVPHLGTASTAPLRPESVELLTSWLDASGLRDELDRPLFPAIKTLGSTWKSDRLGLIVFGRDKLSGVIHQAASAL